MTRLEKIQEYSKFPIILLQYMGLACISFDSKQRVFKYSKQFNFWSSVVFLPAFFAMFYNFNFYYDHVLHVAEKTRFTLVIVYTLYIYTPAIVLIIVIAICKFKQDDVVEVFNGLMKIQIHFKALTLDGQSRLFKYVISGLFLEIVSFNLVEIIIAVYPAVEKGIYEYILQEFLHLMIANYMHLTSMIIEVFHFAFLIMMSSFFTEVDGCFKQASVDKSVYNMRRNLKLHQELYNLAQQINRTWSLPLLFMIGNYFVYFYIHIFGIYSTIRYGDVTEIGLSGIYAVIVITLKMSFYVFVANRTMNQANKIKRTAMDVVIMTRREEIRKETNALALQLCHEEVRIVAGGFFTIDYPLLFDMMAACSTYMVITIQFIEVKI